MEQISDPSESAVGKKVVQLQGPRAVARLSVFIHSSLLQVEAVHSSADGGAGDGGPPTTQDSH